MPKLLQIQELETSLMTQFKKEEPHKEETE